MRFPRGAQLLRIWIITSVVYGAARAIAFDHFLGEYGVKGEVYFLIEVITSVPFALYSAGLINAIKRQQAKAKYILGTASSYFAPDIYLVMEAREAPAHIFLATVAVIAVLFAISTATLLRKTRVSHSKD